MAAANTTGTSAESSRDMQERLINLLIFLDNADHKSASTEVIGRKVMGYERVFDEASRDRLSSKIGNDLTYLQIAGVPIRREDGMVILDSDHFNIPPVNFTEAEATLITLAGSMADGSQLGAFARSGWRKLVVGGRLAPGAANREPVRFLDDSIHVEGQVISTISDALDNNRVCSFKYRPHDKAREQSRLLEPWGMVVHEGKLFLVGWDPKKKDIRCYRASRLSHVSQGSRKATQQRPEPEVIHQLVEQTSENFRSRVDAVVRITDDAPPAAARFARRGEDLGEGRYKLAGIAENEVVAAGLKYGPELVVEEPGQVVSAITAGLDALINHHSD